MAGLPAFAEAKLGFAQAGPGHPSAVIPRKPESSGAERAKKKLDPGFRRGDVDARHKAGHDEVGG